MKKILLVLLLMFMSEVPAFSFEDVAVPYDKTDFRVKQLEEETKPQLITGTVSLVNSIPKGFFGTWKVVSVQVYSNNPFMFNSVSVDFWKLEKTNNNLTLTNPESGAAATVTLEDVKNNTIKFVRTADTPYEKVVETPEITLNGENFFGTDTIVIKSYQNGTLVNKNVVKFRLKGIKQSGARVSDIISK